MTGDLTPYQNPQGPDMGTVLALVGGTALAITGAAVVLPAVAVGALNLLGFSAIGPVAGESSIIRGGADSSRV